MSKAVNAGLSEASVNIKLAWARDKAQIVFTSQHGGINIAPASQPPLACHLLPSYLGHPHCLKEQSTNTACPSKIFIHSLLAENKAHSLTLYDV